ncbi:sigma 54-interacting transcriptional regulator [Photobacterium damselae]|uniref:sigma 54-interacting transcriptional regulator n=1 Tax=Photobacterium damselae TaxID=38293 RepID=UPI0040691C1F
MLEFLFAIRANLSARANGTMERFEADLMSFSKALLSINDISGVMTFLNNEDLLFIQVDRVNLLLKNDIDDTPTLYFLDKANEQKNYQYNQHSLALHKIASCEYYHDISGHELYQTFPQLVDHPAYYDVNRYCKIPLLIAGKPLGAIEYINHKLADSIESERQFKLFNNMIAAMIEHIIEHQLASDFTQQLSNEKKNFQVLVDITNTVISQSTKKELISSLLHFLYQHFAMTELSIIQLQDNHYMQMFCGLNNNNTEFHCHFFNDDKMIKHAIENNKPLLLDHNQLEQIRQDENGPYFPSKVKSACLVPMVFRGLTIGYICYMKRETLNYQQYDIELVQQIASRVALAMHSIKAHQATLPRTETEQYVSIEESYDEHAIFDDIISQSEAMNQVLEKVAMVASCDSTVLILGESGTGKELIARAIHKMSLRSKTRMVKMNCAAIPAGLFESELFGHERGAFTGAISQRVGRFEQAHKGTLFLDEIGDMPLELQPKLLRALQENEIERVGKNQLISVDVRIVVATNVDLLAMVDAKQFRNDLYYRLNVFPIEVPPLRQRAEDIPLLVKHFARQLAQKMGKKITAIAASDLELMQRFSWPGNVRELHNFVERSVILTRGHVLNIPVDELISLQPHIVQNSRKMESQASLSKTSLKQAQELPQVASIDDLTSSGSESVCSVDTAAKNEVKKVRPIVDQSMIINALKRCQGVIAGPNGAANMLGLKRTTLLSRMQKMGISSQDYR